MHLDPLTLMVPGAFATAFSGIFLLGFWLILFRNVPALLWWASASLVNTVGFAVLIVGLGLQIPWIIMTGVGLTTIVPALVWGGVRRFDNHRTPAALLAAGLAAWLAIGLAPFDFDHQKWATIASFASWFVYLPAAIWSLWKNRREKLNARWPLMTFLAVHTVVFVGAARDAWSGTLALNQPPTLDSWFGAVHFETILYAMGTAIFMILMCKERVELGHIKAAKVEALTGTANHGAWFESAGQLVNRIRQEGSPFSLIMFDLDRFKVINDTYGHQAGDEVLRAFADTVRGVLRPDDLFGRYGGEEFIVLVPGATIESAYAIAERIRQAFAETHRFLDGQLLTATVSAGVASASPISTLDAIIKAADKAMYSAKRAGRNRVERASNDRPDNSDRALRVA